MNELINEWMNKKVLTVVPFHFLPGQEWQIEKKKKKKSYYVGFFFCGPINKRNSRSAKLIKLTFLG